MYLLKSNLEKYYTKNYELIDYLQKRIASKEAEVYFFYEPKQDRIFYILNDPILGSTTFYVTNDGTTYRYRADDTGELRDAFCFCMQRNEKKLSDEELQKRYPEIYENEIITRGMSPTELLEYKKTKSEFNSFLSTLEYLDDVQDKKEPSDIDVREETLYFCVDIDDNRYPDSYSVTAYDEKGKKLGPLDTVADWFDGNKRKLTKQSQDILNTLLPGHNQDPYYSNEVRFCLRLLKRGLEMMAKVDYSSLPNVHPLCVESHDYDLDSETKRLQVSMDKDGNIVSNLNLTEAPTICTLMENNLYLFLEYQNSVAHLVECNNPKMLALYKFMQKNPSFNMKYFKKEITTKLIPSIKNSVEIETELLNDSLRMIDHIEYCVDLDIEKMHLLFKTSYFSQGKAVTKEEFSLLQQDLNRRFEQALYDNDLPLEGRMENENRIANFISNPLTSLKKCCSLFISEDVKKLKVKPVAKLNISIVSGQDWFSINFDSSEYSKEEVDGILNAYKKKKKFFLVRDSILSLDDKNSEDVLEILKDFDLKDKKIPIYQVLKLQGNDNVVLPSDIKALFEEIQNYEMHPLSLEENFNQVLRPYQVKGVKWLSTLKENHLSGILADDMGLGKTLEMIAFLSQYHLGKPNLIVCPKSLTYNWEDEFRKWNPKSKVVVLSRDKAERHALVAKMKMDEEVTYIISYDSLRIDLDLFENRQFGFLVLDEGQYIANALSQKARAVKSLKADYKFALTGTPIQNSLMDLWSIFDFLMPGYLKSFTEFKKVYAKYDLEKEDRDHLEHIVSPFLLKRRKDDVLTELPGKIIQTQSLLMDEEETKLYQAYLLKTQKVFENKDSRGKTNKIEVLSALTRLRQLCVDPSTFLDYKNISSKLDYTINLIKEATGKKHKIILFSSFTSVLSHIGKLLEKQKITYEEITGATSATKRLALAKDFNEKDDTKVMLVSLKAGGTGLNLIGGDIVIHLDPWWNIAAEDQASDRAYRIGQKKKVTIYKLVMKNTIEEKVLTLQEKKKDLSSIFDNAEGKSSISDEDIAYLLS